MVILRFLGEAALYRAVRPHCYQAHDAWLLMNGIDDSKAALQLGRCRTSSRVTTPIGRRVAFLPADQRTFRDSF